MEVYKFEIITLESMLNFFLLSCNFIYFEFLKIILNTRAVLNCKIYVCLGEDNFG